MKWDIQELSNVEIRQLTADNSSLPDYVRIIEAHTYSQALQQMITAVYEEPANTAVWLGVEKLVSKETKNFAQYCSEQDKAAMQWETERFTSGFLNERFREHASVFPDIKKFQVGQESFIWHMKFLRKAILQRLGATYMHTEIFPGCGWYPADSGMSRLHTDRFNALYGTQHINDIRDRPTHRFRLLQSWHNAGFMIANPQDWKSGERFIVGFADHFTNSQKPLVLQIPSFALALLTGEPWFHPASTHASLIENPFMDPNSKRFRVRIDFEIPAPR